MKIILLIGAGGFIGTISRYLLGKWIQEWTAVFFPLGTLAVNVLGSLLIGLVFGVADKGTLLSPEWRLFLAVGVLGGFTTFSSFSNDALMLLRDQQFLAFTGYVLLSVMLGLAAVFFGYAITKPL